MCLSWAGHSGGEEGKASYGMLWLLQALLPAAAGLQASSPGEIPGECLPGGRVIVP